MKKVVVSLAATAAMVLGFGQPAQAKSSLKAEVVFIVDKKALKTSGCKHGILAGSGSSSSKIDLALFTYGLHELFVTPSGKHFYLEPVCLTKSQVKSAKAKKLKVTVYGLRKGNVVAYKTITAKKVSGCYC